MLKSALHNYYPGGNQMSEAEERLASSDDPEVTIRRLYREITDLKVRNEFLEQSLQNSNNGLLSDGKLLSDIQDLQSKVGEQQTIIDSQNEMLDEAQLLLQQLKNERDELKLKTNDDQKENDLEKENKILKDEIVELQDHLISANDHIAYLSQQLDNQVLNTVPEVSEEENDYSILQEEHQHVLSWIAEMERSLQISTENMEEPLMKRMERISSKIPSKTSIVENSYISLIQSEINDLYLLIEGCKSDPSPIKQLHTLQDSVRSILSLHQGTSLKNINTSNCIVQEDWSGLYNAITTNNIELKDKQEFISTLQQQLEDMQSKESELINIVESLKTECAESLQLNQELYRESVEVKQISQSQAEQITKLKEKVKKLLSLKEKYKVAVEEIKNRGLLITQYQQLVTEHGLAF